MEYIDLRKMYIELFSLPPYALRVIQTNISIMR